VEVGSGVQDWKAGDRVPVNPLNRERGLIGEIHGGLAEKCLVAQHQLIRMPDGVTYGDAASLPVAYGSAHRMIITHNTIKAGDRVIVLGASGGVGTASRLTGDQLHNQKVAAVGFFNSINRSNVGMIQRRQHPRFTLKTRNTFRIVAEGFW
jgi:NADPH:quinone reductase-like Zn-dependent oxidoreductase